MNLAIIIFIQILAVSLGVNAYLISKMNRVSKEKPKSQELQEFITDLNHGEALVRMSRVDPADVFLRSPRERA